MIVRTLIVGALGALALSGLSACGGEDAKLLPGETAREITANLESVKQLSNEGDCVGAEGAAVQVSEQIEALTGVDRKLKDALQEGAERLSEVVEECEAAEEPEEVETAEVPEEEQEPDQAAEKRQEKEQEKAEKEQEKEERKEEEAPPPAEEPKGPPGQEKTPPGQEKTPPGQEETPSGGIESGNPAEGEQGGD